MILYGTITEDMFKETRYDFAYSKGDSRVRFDHLNNKVALSYKGRFYAQQFGTLEQAHAKYRELVDKLKKGEDLC